MRHVEIAYNKLSKELEDSGRSKDVLKYIAIENAQDVVGVCPVVKFTIQSDPVSVVGVNGCQAVDILEYVKFLITSLDEFNPDIHNKITITLINSALKRQEVRKNDRLSRGVEGTNKP